MSKMTSASVNVTLLRNNKSFQTVLLCTMGDLYQRYTGSVNAPDSVAPDFQNLYNNPSTHAKAVRLQAFAYPTFGTDPAAVSAVRWYVGGAEITFASVADADGTFLSTGTYAGLFRKGAFSASGAVANELIICGNLVSKLQQSTTFRCELDIQPDPQVTDLATASMQIPYSVSQVAQDTFTCVAYERSGKGMLITANQEQLELAAILYRGTTVVADSGSTTYDSTAATFEWAELDTATAAWTPRTPTAGTGSDTSQVLKVSEPEVESQSNFKAVAKVGGKEVAMDLADVSDVSDPYVIEPHNVPEDGVVRESGTTGVSFAPTLVSRTPSVTVTQPAKFRFTVYGADGVIVTPNNAVAGQQYYEGLTMTLDHAFCVSVGDFRVTISCDIPV